MNIDISEKNKPYIMFNRKYDYIFSIGASCSCSTVLKKLLYRRLSGPFDWNWGADFTKRIDIILSDFENFFDKEYLIKVEDPTALNDKYKNSKTGVIFNHDFPKGSDFEEEYYQADARYIRRVKECLNI